MFTSWKHWDLFLPHLVLQTLLFDLFAGCLAHKLPDIQPLHPLQLEVSQTASRSHQPSCQKYSHGYGILGGGVNSS